MSASGIQSRILFLAHSSVIPGPNGRGQCFNRHLALVCSNEGILVGCLVYIPCLGNLSPLLGPLYQVLYRFFIVSFAAFFSAMLTDDISLMVNQS